MAPNNIIRINAAVPSADDELDSPIDSLSNMSLEDEAADAVRALPKVKQHILARPELSARSSTDPSPSLLLQDYFTNAQKPSSNSSSHRNRSPYSRSHLRSRSSGSALLSAPAMTRAHSMPNPNIFRISGDSSSASTSSSSLSPAPRSPMRSPVRVRSPFRVPSEENVGPPPRSPSFGSGLGIESIQEDSELDITRPRTSGPALPSNSASASFSRSGSLRRRPASPLHSLVNVQAAQPHPAPTSFPGTLDPSALNHTSISGSSSPALGPQRSERFNESFPSLHHYASTSSFSSMPSTPTSARSRSPSISSLDTIEDAPDLESEAIENERIETLKLAAERQERMERGEDVEDAGTRRRSSLDVPRSGFSRAGRERKRWSICGGERRADLDLETIWED